MDNMKSVHDTKEKEKRGWLDLYTISTTPLIRVFPIVVPWVGITASHLSQSLLPYSAYLSAAFLHLSAPAIVVALLSQQ